MGGNTALVGGGSYSQGENVFTVDIFIKNTSKYAKVMVESCTRCKLNQIHRDLLILTKNFFKFILSKKIVWKVTDLFQN